MREPLPKLVSNYRLTLLALRMGLYGQLMPAVGRQGPRTRSPTRSISNLELQAQHGRPGGPNLSAAGAAVANHGVVGQWGNPCGLVGRPLRARRSREVIRLVAKHSRIRILAGCSPVSCGSWPGYVLCGVGSWHLSVASSGTSICWSRLVLSRCGCRRGR